MTKRITAKRTKGKVDLGGFNLPDEEEAIEALFNVDDLSEIVHEALKSYLSKRASSAIKQAKKMAASAIEHCARDGLDLFVHQTPGKFSFYIYDLGGDIDDPPKFQGDLKDIIDSLCAEVAEGVFPIGKAKKWREALVESAKRIDASIEAAKKAET
jgi:hypothetical protein